MDEEKVIDSKNNFKLKEEFNFIQKYKLPYESTNDILSFKKRVDFIKLKSSKINLIKEYYPWLNMMPNYELRDNNPKTSSYKPVFFVPDSIDIFDNGKLIANYDNKEKEFRPILISKGKISEKLNEQFYDFFYKFMVK